LCQNENRKGAPPVSQPPGGLLASGYECGRWHFVCRRAQHADAEAQRARVVAETGPAHYLAELFGSDNIEAVV
jgi:hypothetical protein